MPENAANPLISVLMVNYNHADSLRQAVESVLGQTYANLELIVVDDGSTDDSCQIIQAFNDPRVRLVRLPENRHICAATNMGFSQVTGQYLARLDSDDCWEPQKLEKQLAYLREHPGCRIVFTRVNLTDQDGNNVNEKMPDHFQMFEYEACSQVDWLRTFFFEGNHLAHSSVLMEMSLMRQIGPFDMAYGQCHDFDYWIRAAKICDLPIMPERLTNMRRYDAEGEEEDVNNSEANERNSTMFWNEHLLMRSRFFDGMSDELFIKVFQPYFRNPASAAPLELECEKAFLLLNPETFDGAVCFAGVQRMQGLLNDSQALALLEGSFGYTVRDFYDLMRQHINYDRVLRNATTAEMDRLTTENGLLDAERNHLLEEIRMSQTHSGNLEAYVKDLERTRDDLTAQLEEATKEHWPFRGSKK